MKDLIKEKLRKILEEAELSNPRAIVLNQQLNKHGFDLFKLDHRVKNGTLYVSVDYDGYDKLEDLRLVLSEIVYMPINKNSIQEFNGGYVLIVDDIDWEMFDDYDNY